MSIGNCIAVVGLCRLEASPAVAASPDAKRAKKKKLHAGDVSASDLANDKVLQTDGSSKI